MSGFLGQSPDKKITTLGRGGSDLTATVIGVAVGVDEVQASERPFHVIFRVVCFRRWLMAGHVFRKIGSLLMWVLLWLMLLLIGDVGRCDGVGAVFGSIIVGVRDAVSDDGNDGIVVFVFFCFSVFDGFYNVGCRCGFVCSVGFVIRFD